MKTSTVAAVLFTTLGATFLAHAETGNSFSQTPASSQKSAPKLSDTQRASEKAAAQARFAAMSIQDKAANKGNKQKPSKPAAPSAPQGRK